MSGSETAWKLGTLLAWVRFSSLPKGDVQHRIILPAPGFKPMTFLTHSFLIILAALSLQT